MIGQASFQCLFDSSVIKLNREDINSTSSEYAPSFFDNGIIFSSNRDYSFGIETYNEADKTRLDDLYFASYGKDSSLNSPEFIKSINTRLQEGTSSFDFLTKTLYFSSTIKVKGKMVLTIYQSKLSPTGEWGKRSPAITPKKSFSYFHPCVTNDGNTLIFASDELDKTRGSDLFISNFLNGEWSEPVSLGDIINSDKNDGYPFVDNLGNLFFASKGHSGYGGYDIFFSENINGVFQKPINLGTPINSSFDDFSLIVDPVKRYGYFSTNRFEGLNDEILKFDILFPIFSNCISYATPTYCYDFIEENSLSGEDTSGFFFEWIFGDGYKSKGISVNHCYAKTGNYAVELNILDNATGQLFMNQINYDLTVEEAQMLHIKSPDTVFVGDIVNFDSKGSSLLGYKITNYFWNFPNGYMTKSATVNQFFNKIGEYEVKLGITAIKDSSSKQEVFTFCTSKKIIVLPANQKNLNVKNKEVNTFIGKLQDFGTSVFDVSKIKNPEYTVYLGSSEQKVDVQNLLVDNPGNIRVIYEDSLYRYLYNSKKTMKEIIQEYIKAKKWGNANAFVIVLSGDSVVSNQFNSKNDFSVKYKNTNDIVSNTSTSNNTVDSTKNDTYLIVVKNDSVAENSTTKYNDGNSGNSTNKNTTSTETKNNSTNNYSNSGNTTSEIKITPELKIADKNNDGKISPTEMNSVIDAFFDGSDNFKIGELYTLVNLKNSGLTAFPQWVDTTVIYFEFNKYDLGNYTSINKVVDQYKNGTISDFIVIGFADSVGSIGYNLTLSQMRCKTIQDYLSVNGVSKSKIKSFWYGETIPPEYEKFISKLDLSRCVLIIPRIIKSSKS